ADRTADLRSGGAAQELPRHRPDRHPPPAGRRPGGTAAHSRLPALPGGGRGGRPRARGADPGDLHRGRGRM
ncbi:MAG: hypothetical protein AVDCRST_MAG68-4375, partial [uncultured Gemmatimonadetes bacterium]